VDSLQLLGEFIDHHDVPASEIWPLRNNVSSGRLVSRDRQVRNTHAHDLVIIGVQAYRVSAHRTRNRTVVDSNLELNKR
jgi:hypothetical protein